MLLKRQKIFMSPAMLGVPHHSRPNVVKKEIKDNWEAEKKAQEKKNHEIIANSNFTEDAAVRAAKEEQKIKDKEISKKKAKEKTAKSNSKKEVSGPAEKKAQEKTARTTVTTSASSNESALKNKPNIKGRNKESVLKRIRKVYKGTSKYGKRGKVLAISGTALTGATAIGGSLYTANKYRYKGEN